VIQNEHELNQAIERERAAAVEERFGEPVEDERAEWEAEDREDERRHGLR